MTRQHAVIASRLVVTAIRQRAELLRGRPEERARALRAIETVRRIAKERRVESMAAVQLIRCLDRVRGGIPHAVDAPQAQERKSRRRLDNRGNVARFRIDQALATCPVEAAAATTRDE